MFEPDDKKVSEYGLTVVKKRARTLSFEGRKNLRDRKIESERVHQEISDLCFEISM